MASAPTCVPATRARQVAGPLRPRSVEADLVHAEIGMGAVAEAHGCRRPADFLHGNDMLEVAEAGTAVFLLDRHAEQPHRPHLLPQVVRERHWTRRCRAARGAISRAANPCTLVRSMSAVSPRLKLKLAGAFESI